MSRKGVGGRKPTQIPNPFVRLNEWDIQENILCYDDRMDIRVEDTIIGVVRSYNAESDRRQQVVNWLKVYKVFRNCNVITRQVVQDYLQCSKAQAERYIKVIKLANLFLQRVVEGASGSDIIGYPDMHMYKRKVKSLSLSELKDFAN